MAPRTHDPIEHSATSSAVYTNYDICSNSCPDASTPTLPHTTSPSIRREEIPGQQPPRALGPEKSEASSITIIYDESGFPLGQISEIRRD